MIKPLRGFMFDLDIAHLPILYSPVFRQVYFPFRFRQVLKIPFDVFWPIRFCFLLERS